MASQIPGIFHCILSRIYRNKTYAMLQGYFLFTKKYRMLCTWERSIKVKDCYLLLGVDWSATVIDVREAYLKLAKLYHPDCGRNTADAAKFSKIEHAYRVVMDHVTSASQKGSEVSDQDFEKEIFDIHHTAPQHRYCLPPTVIKFTNNEWVDGDLLAAGGGRSLIVSSAKFMSLRPSNHSPTLF